MRRSAGLLPFRRAADGPPEVFLGHMGGPLWARREQGAWTVIKGEVDPGEDAAATAEREFAEETGLAVPSGPRVPLGTVRQRGGKEVTVWAVEADLDADAAVSGTFEMPWPPRSGHVQAFPEIDRFRWWPLVAARDVVVGAQVELLDRLAAAVGTLVVPGAPDASG
ncbi:DNA mismatch repair protein MutT [Actinotalea ferrariae CF5-4]|uniref:DNA mismatch repair protein MutT n=1 Tax=Actinotalea ferrariae CF5-4 TaxID=948458 RepID=A0A021VUG9_9CELL|nr:DNA mismatch repair protein MutT [Actinotalea ferrariae CF5-4]